MAGILKKDEKTYMKEKESFLKELQQFHETRGTPFRNGPKISGHLIDLYLLYALVTEQGGWVKVNSRNEWNKILEELNLPKHCVNCSVAVKQVYLRYLDRYEKVHFLGEVGERISEDDEDSRHKKWSMRALHSVPLSYNHAQHNINDSLREYNGLSIDMYKSSEYDKLGLSLISPLSNEQDFAINVCTLLSHEGKQSFKLEKHPRILHYLLAHAAVFSHSNLSTLFSDHYSKVRGHSLSRFWHDILCDSSLIRLIDESQFEECDLEDIGLDETDKLAMTRHKNGLTLRPQDTELFCLGRTLGTQDYVGQRVLQVANIVRNLTFVRENLDVMKKDSASLRFVLLCCGSDWSSLRQLGWDMLANLATDITVLCPMMSEILAITLQGLESSDRAQIISSLEVLNKISQNVNNEDYLLKYLEIKVYERICTMLTVRDIMLLIYTLECIFSLSSLGEKACDSILKVRGIVDTLVSLVTVDTQSFGPKSFINMNVTETVTSCSGSNAADECTTVTAVPVASSARETSPAAASQTSSELHAPPCPSGTSIQTALPQLVVAPQVVSAPQQVQIQTQAQMQQRVAATDNAPSATIYPTQQVAQENELFAMAWLKTTFEVNPSTCIEQRELYKQYINHCSKFGRRGVIAPLHFPRCVRSVFGVNVGPKATNCGDSIQQFYEGIQVRAKPSASPNPDIPIPQTPSPILKAQLSAPPKATSPSPLPVKEVAERTVSTFEQGATSLIKSLLATKVTQRQQQQKLLQKSNDQQTNSEEGSASSISSQSGHVDAAVSVIEKPSVASVACSTASFHSKGVQFKSYATQSTPADCPIKKEFEIELENSVSTSTDNLIGQSQSNTFGNSVKIVQPTSDHEYAESKRAKLSCGESSGSYVLIDPATCGNLLKDGSKRPPLLKNVMLVDLLEKNIVKSEPPPLNGTLRLGDRGLELVQETGGCTISIPEYEDTPERESIVIIKDEKVNLKRVKEEHEPVDTKKPRMIRNPPVKDEPPEDGNVSSSAANLYAALAADALEDEVIEETSDSSVATSTSSSTTTQHRPIIVTAGPQIAQRVVVNGQHYVVAQPQTALVQGHMQTVLLAQAAQQHGSPKTIIILQPQNVASTSTHQKLLVQNFQTSPPPLISSSPIKSVSPPKSVSVSTSPQPPVIPQTIVKSISTNMLSGQIQNASTSTNAVLSIPAPCATPVNVPHSPQVTTTTMTSSSTQSSSTSSKCSNVTDIPSLKIIDKGSFVCEWRGCMRSFKSVNEVYMHACEVHCPQGSHEIQCLWERCDSVKRKRLSHMTHLFDRHCNSEMMRIMAARRKQQSLSGRTETSQQTSPHPGYAPNAAFNAIKRHALDFVSAKDVQQRVNKVNLAPSSTKLEQEDNECPITKSIRLTASLILRNLVVFSNNGKRHLSRFEPHLANVALSGVESSRTLAQVLFDMAQRS